MQEQIEQAIKEIAKRTEAKGAPDWANQDNILAKIEAIRLRAYQEIVALGLSEEDGLSVDVSIVPDDNDLFHLARSLGWKTRHNWYEPPIPTQAGDITIYFEPEEKILW